MNFFWSFTEGQQINHFEAVTGGSVLASGEQPPATVIHVLLLFSFFGVTDRVKYGGSTLSKIQKDR
jgi:hypothetical protein